MISFQNSRITVFQSALYHTTSSVITLDDCTIVVDPTWLPHEVQEIRAYVDQLGKGWPVYLIFTHSDWDHILGYGAFPEAKVIASAKFQQQPERTDIVEQIQTFDDRYYLKRDYDITYPEVDLVIHEDGQQLQLGQTTVTFYLSPGHTADGIITVIEPEGILLAGDYLSDIEFPYVYSSSVDYEATMEKLEQVLSRHDVRVLVPGHGNVTTDPAAMKARIEQSVRYLQTVRQYVNEGNQARLDAMIDQVPFPRGMKNYHEHNQQIIRKELEQL